METVPKRYLKVLAIKVVRARPTLELAPVMKAVFAIVLKLVLVGSGWPWMDCLGCLNNPTNHMHPLTSYTTPRKFEDFPLCLSRHPAQTLLSNSR